VRIAIVNSHYFPDEVGGAERSIRTLAESAVAHGHETAVFTTGRVRETTHINGVRVERFQRANSAAVMPRRVAKALWHVRDIYRPRVAAEIAQAIEPFAPDVAHTNNLSGISVALWERLKSSGLPIAHTLRDYYLMCPNTARFRSGKPCTGICASCRVLSAPRLAATRRVTSVIGNSRFILQAHLSLGAFANARHEVIYNGYRPAEPASARPPVPVCRPLTFGFIGRLVPSKGIELLIEAFRHVTHTLRRAVRLHIGGVGKPEYLRRLRELAGEHAVTFRGHVEPNEFYHSVDIAVVPSIWDEPLARVIFESFAHGLPVIASTRGGSPELVVPGRTGWVFDSSSYASLESALLSAVHVSGTEEYRRLSTSCLSEAHRFLPERTLGGYIAALQATAAASRPAGA
jgi:glycosyltransferase involved in cell wall biosynthesis